MTGVIESKPLVHGTVQAYWRGCHCTECKKAQAEYQHVKRSNNEPLAPDDPRHGRYTTYNNHNCRCDRCTAAITKQRQNYKRRKKEESQS